MGTYFSGSPCSFPAEEELEIQSRMLQYIVKKCLDNFDKTVVGKLNEIIIKKDFFAINITLTRILYRTLNISSNVTLNLTLNQTLNLILKLTLTLILNLNLTKNLSPKLNLTLNRTLNLALNLTQK